jgi:hypothetical protein
LGEKFYNSLKIGPNFFLQHFKTKILYNFVKFVATLKGMTSNFFLPLSFVAVFGSGIRDLRSEIRDPRSGIRDPGWVKIRIRDKHPGSATLLVADGSDHLILSATEGHDERSIGLVEGDEGGLARIVADDCHR